MREVSAVDQLDESIPTPVVLRKGFSSTSASNVAMVAFLRVYFTDQQMQRVADHAERLGLTPGAYLRMLVLKDAE